MSDGGVSREMREMQILLLFLPFLLFSTCKRDVRGVTHFTDNPKKKSVTV